MVASYAILSLSLPAAQCNGRLPSRSLLLHKNLIFSTVNLANSALRRLTSPICKALLPVGENGNMGYMRI